MKILRLSTALVMAVATSFAFAANDKSIVPDHPIQLMGGPGIAISGTATKSQLPANAQQFLDNNYANDAITSCKQDYVKGTSNVTLADGTKIEFDKNGKVRDITSGQNQPLSEGVLMSVLPEKTLIHLAEVGAINMVSSIKNADGKGTCVMLLDNTPPQMIFDVDGAFIITAG